MDECIVSFDEDREVQLVAWWSDDPSVTTVDIRLDSLEAIAPTPVVTSLPGSPVTGQRILYKFTQTVNPTNAKDIYWPLIWDGTAWYPTGGCEPLYGYTAASATFAAFGANVWGGVDANDPSVTFPLAGDYEIQWGTGQFFHAIAGNWFISAYFSTGDQTANGTPPTADILTVSGTATFGSGHSSKKMNIPTIGNIIRMRYYMQVGGAANLTRGSAYVKAYPRKITP
jgi:hypothetical protein